MKMSCLSCSADSLSSPTKGRRFFSRHFMFKTAVIGLCASVVAYLVGFSTTAWYFTEKGSHFGLWKYCPIKKATCQNLLDLSDTDYWFVDATRSLCCFCLILLLVGMGVELYQDFLINDPQSDNRALEGIITVAAFLGLIGATVFIAKFSALRPDDALSDYIGWSFWITFGACLAALLSTYLLLCFRSSRSKKPSDIRNTRNVTVVDALPSLSAAPYIVPDAPMYSSSNPASGSYGTQTTNAPPFPGRQLLPPWYHGSPMSGDALFCDYGHKAPTPPPYSSLYAVKSEV